jgi:hypothetical protein
MTRSIVFAALLVAALAGCSRNTPPPVAAEASVNSLTSGFVPYCGPIWSVGKQGYVEIPCPPGINYHPGGAR